MAGESTCWTVIAGAASGAATDREQFARVYAPVVRAYLSARWRGSVLVNDLDDAVQDVFVECFRSGGALARVDPERTGGFRPFLYGVIRNVALRLEEAQARRRMAALESGIVADDDSLATVFDRAWITSLLRLAAEQQSTRAVSDEARRRVELLRLRFQEGLPIRDIAGRWNVDAAKVHHEYARARDEYRAALVQVLAFHHPGVSSGEIERQCEELLGHFS